jgi:hypothetical protein
MTDAHSISLFTFIQSKNPKKNIKSFFAAEKPKKNLKNLNENKLLKY